MFECPACHDMMEEIFTSVTLCCGMVIGEEDCECPGCGVESPEIAEGESRLLCNNCGYVE